MGKTAEEDNNITQIWFALSRAGVDHNHCHYESFKKLFQIMNSLKTYKMLNLYDKKFIIALSSSMYAINYLSIYL